jgi:hypothetical protein
VVERSLDVRDEDLTLLCEQTIATTIRASRPQPIS